uniref:Tetratricopeptide repeat domain 12 n=1 Tax=Amphiprion percula TaxID=161767 RepID=A0A3P8SZF2_AMPPE
VEHLRSSDVEVQQKALADTDCYIATLDEPCRTKVNKTTINTNPPLQPFLVKTCRQSELDTVEPVVLLSLKDKGNEAYAKEDYETAVKYYSDGLAELRDMQPLYTNRAQAYIKLGKYKEAISDCEWALKCNERCMKAYLHMGKAYLGLKKYNEVKYLTQVDLEEERDSQEMNAKQEFDKAERTATIVPQLLEKLSRPGQMPLFYCGGLELLSQAITDSECSFGRGFAQLFSSSNLFDHSFFSIICFTGETNDPDSDELCASVLKLWRLICCGNGMSIIALHFIFCLCPYINLLAVDMKLEFTNTHSACLMSLLFLCLPTQGTGQTATKYAIKILIVCTAASHLAREELLKSDKKLSILRHLLSSSCDEMVSGNAALCLAHCLELEGVASRLLGTDIVLLLLRHAAGDSKRTAVQRNAAIALGKLCRSEPRHMSKLRELHGLEILHSCVKLIS